MLNRRGFTLYELLITYSLSFIVIISIFSSIVDLSNKLSKLYIKDSITANQLLVYRSIGNDFAYYKINNIYKCQDNENNDIPNCATIVFEDKDSQPKYKNLEIGTNYITYDDIKTEFKYGSINLSNTGFSSISTNYNDSEYLKRIIKLYIPISYESNNYNITLFCTNGINIEEKLPSEILNNLFV